MIFATSLRLTRSLRILVLGHGAANIGDVGTRKMIKRILKCWLLPEAKVHRGLRGALAIWLAALTVGVSLPVSHPSKLSDRPYPCQHHRCGCHDADHCWQSCCCMTREQKFAWAVEHGVTPPESFFAQAPELRPHERIASQAKSCCAKRHRRTAAAAAQACQSPPAATQETSSKQVALLDVLRCHGDEMSWTATIPPSLRPDAAIGESLAGGPSSALPAERALIFSALTYEPPVPPPRS